jgi:hypothetical protein
VFGDKGVQAGRTCYLNCTQSFFISCTGGDVEPQTVTAPQDIAQGDCEDGAGCGFESSPNMVEKAREAATEQKSVDELGNAFASIISGQIDGKLSKADLQVLASVSSSGKKTQPNLKNDKKQQQQGMLKKKGGASDELSDRQLEELFKRQEQVMAAKH